MNLSTLKARQYVKKTQVNQVIHIQENTDKKTGYFIRLFQCSPSQFKILKNLAGVSIQDGRISTKLASDGIKVAE